MTDSNIPIVSVVMATYNRPDVLKYAIESVIWQTYQNWELLVVGDACSESTERVLEDYKDPKIRYHNFKENFGEQSGPNNWGIINAKGDYIAFLNHDDLYFSDHLEKMIHASSQIDADVLYSMSLAFRPDNSIFIGCYTPGSKYTPKLLVPASCWLVKRSTFDKVGKWRSFKEIYGIPSYDWLFRAWRQGIRIEPVGHVGVLAITSGFRDHSYLEESSIHAEVFNEIRSDPHYRGRLIAGALLEDTFPNSNYGSVIRQFGYAFKNLIMSLLIWIGISPSGFLMLLRYRKKGGFINHLRKNRGLIPK